MQINAWRQSGSWLEQVPPCRYFGYHTVMTEITTRPSLSALPPTEAELAAWHALSREEQLARYRETLQAADAGRVSKATMADVLAAARQKVAARRG
jgi:predicted DNA-binding protein (UPF0251 family)